MAAPQMASQPLSKGSIDRQNAARPVAARIGGRRSSWFRVAIVGLASVFAALAAWGFLSGARRHPIPMPSGAAQADLKANRFDRVEDGIARLGRLRQPNAADRMLRGQLAVARERPDEALAELARVPDDSPLAPQARLLAGQVELRRNRFRFAEEAFRAAVRIDPALVRAHRELIYIYGYQLRRDGLDEEFLALSRVTDLRDKELFHWGLLKNDSWEPSEAADVLARSLAADPDDRWTRPALAENQRKMGHLEESEATLSRLAPDDPRAIATRVQLAMDRGDDRAAERLLATGPAAEPALARLRGRLALSRRDAAAAVRHFRIACEAQPDSREALSGLIAALGIQGEARAAAPFRDVAARLDRFEVLIQRRLEGRARRPRGAAPPGRSLRGLAPRCRGPRLVQARHRPRPAQHPGPARCTTWVPPPGGNRAGPARTELDGLP